MSRSVAVIGGGITGISAAREAARLGADVHLFEASDVLGGKIAEVELDGRVLPTAPDNFLARRPEVTDFAISLGLESELVSPAAASPRIFRDGRLYPLPPNVLGIPATADLTPGLLSEDGIARLGADLEMADSAPDGDESAGDLIRRRLGDEALEYLVDPLLGGINAGDSDQLSITSGVPQLLALRDRDPSLIEAAAATRAKGSTSTAGPVFQSIAGGLSRLVEAAQADLYDLSVQMHLGSEAKLERRDDGWQVVTDMTSLDIDHVIVTTPAYVSGSLIEVFAPNGAAALRAIDYSSVALTLLVLPPQTIDIDPAISGVLVPRLEGLHITAVSFASHKWPTLARDGAQVLRVSTGRRNKTAWQGLSDDELVTAIRSDLGTIFDAEIPPGPTHITRWMQALPQYDVGHAEKIAAIDDALASLPGLTLTGAWRNGLGLPACVASGKAAAKAALR